MHEEMRTLLNAYLDGELHGRRLTELENHLASCNACQDELRELRLVSDCLKADPDPEFIPAERFVAQVALSLPRRSLHPRPPQPGWVAWWLIPAGLLGAWFFVQTVFTLTNIITAANLTGVLGHTFSWLGNLGGGQETAWYSATTSLFGARLVAQPILSLLNNVNVYGVELVSGFVWQALIVLLYWAWLFIWWLRSNSPQIKAQNAS